MLQNELREIENAQATKIFFSLFHLATLSETEIPIIRDMYIAIHSAVTLNVILLQLLIAAAGHLKAAKILTNYSISKLYHLWTNHVNKLNTADIDPKLFFC